METTLGHRNGYGTNTEAKRRGTPPKLVCPNCGGNARIDKVSSVVRRGRGRMIWESGEVAHYETELSELLAPPPPPEPLPFRRLIVRVLTSFLVLGLLLALLVGIAVQDFVTMETSVITAARRIAIAWFAFLVPAMLVFQFLRARKEYRRLLPVWLSARRRWSGLYYCPNDDLVFAPVLGASVPPAEIEALIYPVATLPTAGQPSPRPPSVALRNGGHLRTAK